MDADSERARCILCDVTMTAPRNLGREEPMLLCLACRRRSTAERAVLRDQMIARRVETPLPLETFPASNLHPATHGGARVLAVGRDLRARAGQAIARVQQARANLDRALLRAQSLAQHLDALLCDARDA